MPDIRRLAQSIQRKNAELISLEDKNYLFLEKMFEDVKKVKALLEDLAVGGLQLDDETQGREVNKYAKEVASAFKEAHALVKETHKKMGDVLDKRTVKV